VQRVGPGGDGGLGFGGAGEAAEDLFGFGFDVAEFLFCLEEEVLVGMERWWAEECGGTDLLVVYRGCQHES